MKKILILIIISVAIGILGIVGIALAVQYDWILGQPVQTDNTNYEWSGGVPYIVYNFFDAVSSSPEMASANYKLLYSSINTGGHSQTSANYKMRDTIGDIARGLSSNNYKLDSGYQAMIGDLPVLIFSVNDNTADLGTLSISLASTDSGSPSSFSVATNADDGYVVTVSGNTLTNGANDINGIGATAATSSTGTEQFAINLVANTSPLIGANSSGGSGTASGQYAIVNNFAFNSGDTIASASSFSTTTTFTISYLGNISFSTVAGSYSTNLTLVATGTF